MIVVVPDSPGRTADRKRSDGTVDPAPWHCDRRSSVKSHGDEPALAHRTMVNGGYGAYQALTYRCVRRPQ